MGKEYGQNMLTLLDYITDSLMLETPMISNDPAYQQLEDKIPSIINMTLLSMGKDVETLTGEEMHYISLKCMHTLYLRLAVVVAPEFEGSAEQVTFKKGQRFAHYISLADKIKQELNDTYPGFVETTDVRIVSRNGTRRNYNLGDTQVVNPSIETISQDYVELGWNRFNLSYGEFAKYAVIYDTEKIYDEYAIPKIKVRQGAFVQDFYDINRTKLRLTNLKPDTHYYIVVVLVGRDGVKSVEQVEIDTLTLDSEDTPSGDATEGGEQP